jgi:S-adenosylmethionine/arginine decarboxylase-like enzyme
MNKLGTTQTFWVDGDQVREGITGINVIETSHIAAHFWNYPERRILHHPKSRTLLQFDIYTCSPLTNHQIITALEHLDQFQPTHASITLLNRKWSLTIDRHMNWTLPTKLSSPLTSPHTNTQSINRSSNRGETWKDWLEKQKIT